MPYKTKGNRLVNEVTLGDGYPLSYNLKPLKVGGKTSPLEMSTAYPDNSVDAKVKVVGDLEVTGKITGNDESADITGVRLTADDANTATDSEGSADFTIAGGEGIDTSVSGTTVTIAGEAASTTNRGVLELATSAETNTGTDTDRAVTPDGLEDWEGSEQIENLGTISEGAWEGQAVHADHVGQLPTSKITSGTFDDARIASSNVTQHELDIDAVGDLNAGSITSGFGNINNGSNSITTTGLIGTSSRLSAGEITVTTPTLTTATDDDYSIKSIQTLNDTSAEGGTQEYAQIKTELTATDVTGWDNVYLINQQVDGASKFVVDNSGAATFAGTVTSSNGVSGQWCASGNSAISYRGNTVDYWYVGNQSLGDAITTGDFGTYKFSSAMFTAHHSVQLQAWNLTTTFSSGHDFEVEMWDIEVSSGGSYADSATKIGATQSVTAQALKIYSIGQQSLDYTLAAGHLLFMPIRYTDGSGTFYTYGTVGMEFTNA